MKTTAMILATVAVVASGCGHKLVVEPARVVQAPDGADKAFELVAMFFDLKGRPTIVWYASDGCGDGTGYIDVTGTCVNGNQEGDLIILSDRGGLPLHETGMSHELGHRTSDERGEGGDADHMGHFFRDPGEDLSQEFDRGNNRGDIGAAKRLLIALGL
jgi:hypothetical protein